MKYITRVVYTNPGGGTDLIEYWMARDEEEMEAMLAYGKNTSYVGVTCLGPIVEPDEYAKIKIKEAEKGRRENFRPKTAIAETSHFREKGATR